MPSDAIKEARRQAEICNACRYCEGYCSVFPALHSMRAFSDGNITHLANLCHNCRGCYYACQYTAPHEFNLNIPAVLAEVRRESWEVHAWPQPVARAFQRSGVAISLFLVAALASMFFLIQSLPNGEGEGFYAIVPHSLMVAIFAPAFLLPLISIGISVFRFWKTTYASESGSAHLTRSLAAAGSMSNLSGGHGDGCNFEDEDRFSHARRYAHQLVMFGFLLCFLSTASGTVMHYGFNWPAPYGFWTPPKLLGVSGGVMMVFGTLWMAALKLRADKELDDVSSWGGQMATIWLLFLTAFSGLLLYVLGSSDWMPQMLALHLGSVLGLFLLLPYTKIVHGFFRLVAMARS